MSDRAGAISGRCMCGAVRFAGRRADDALHACHCRECRRWSGHVWAAIVGRDVRIEGPVRWFGSSPGSERGFCATCGSSLFMRDAGRTDEIDIAPGCLDQPTDMTLNGHIFMAEKGDYYDVADGAPQWPAGDGDGDG